MSLDEYHFAKGNEMISQLKSLVYAVIDKLRTKSLSDEYLIWLGFANAGMLHKGNAYAMRFVVENLSSTKPILEIGSFCGLSTNVINYFLSAQGKKNKLFSCDRWIFEGAENGGNLGDSQISHLQYHGFVKSTFMRNVEFFSPNNKPHTIESFSDEFFILWNKKEAVDDLFGRSVQLGGEFSFCYIDGNHTYAFAKRDFDNVDKHLEVGGFVLFDDSSDGNIFGLSRLMKEIRGKDNYELVMKNPNYLFKKIA